MSDTKNDNTDSSAGEATKSIWDNDLPAGDSPALPRWPLTASIIAYSTWIVFLVVMMIVRLSTTN